MKKISAESLRQLAEETQSNLICVAVFESTSTDTEMVMHITNHNLTYEHLHCLAQAILCEMNAMRQDLSYVMVSANEIISLN